MHRIPASERTRETLRALIDGQSEVTDERSELVRAGGAADHRGGICKAKQEMPGRSDYYARGAQPGAGYRNGYRRDRVPSAEGASSTVRRRSPEETVKIS
jgi:hypothetical protein